MKDTHGGERRILLGQIVSVHGIRGDVIVKTFTGEPADIASYGVLTDRDGKAPLALSIVRINDKGVIARVKGVSDRNSAEALRGRELYVARDQLPDADDDEYYHADLIGLKALSADGAVLGTIAAVLNYGAGDLLEISRPGIKETDVVPFNNACVPHVDLAAGSVTVIMPTMTGEPEPQSENGDEV